MKKEEEKVNFDISKLSLNELIKAYSDISEFLEFLEAKKILPKEEENANNE